MDAFTDVVRPLPSRLVPLLGAITVRTLPQQNSGLQQHLIRDDTILDLRDVLAVTAVQLAQLSSRGSSARGRSRSRHGR